MGVLIHPSYPDERVNGVAVTEDVVYQTGEQQRGRSYYVNAQLGEDLVTNPEGAAVPEELLLSPRYPRDDVLVRRSNRVDAPTRLLQGKRLDELRLGLKTIHREFRKLYGKEPGDRFAMEIEFKVTAAGRLVIKQARPWVY